MNDTLNSIRLRGRISSEPRYDHTVYGEAFYTAELAVKRLSGAEDCLPVTVSERLLLDPSVNPCELGTPMTVEGQIRSYNQRAGERSRLIITVFAREIAFPPEPLGDEEAGEETPAVCDLNEAELCGTVCKPVIYRVTPFSREIADVLIAVNRRYGKSDYLPCIAWGRNARFAESLTVGDTVMLRGRLQSRRYQKALPDGSAEQRVAYEISCSSIEKTSF